MGEPVLNYDELQNESTEKWHIKKVPIAGYSERLRQQTLEKQIRIFEKSNWEFIEYLDDGATRSYATFRRKMVHSDERKKEYTESTSNFATFFGYLLMSIFLVSILTAIPYYLNLTFSMVSAIFLFQKRSKNYLSQKPFLKGTTKALVFAFAFSSLTSYSLYKKNQIISEQTSLVEKSITNANSQIEEKKFDEAVKTLSSTFKYDKAKNSEEAKELHDTLVQMSTEQFIREKVLRLSEDEFKMLLNKKLQLGNYKNVIINNEITKRMESIAPKLKKQYYKIFAKKIAAEKKEKARQAELAKEKAEYDRIVAKIGSKPENSPWDGSVRPAERWLKNNLKDPDSLKDEQWYQVKLVTLKGQHYWHTVVKYRAKNSFGAYILGAHEFYIQQNSVVMAKSL